MFSKFYIYFRNFSYKSIYINVSNQLKNKYNTILRNNIRKLYFLCQPYRSFDYNKKAIKNTNKTIDYIYNLPNYSIQKINANIFLVKNVLQHVWQIYANNPIRICGSFLSSYCILSMFFKDS